MNLIFLGAPGAGKGTQAEIVSRRLSVPIISTGNILREAIRAGTELGLKAKSFIDAGDLVPDDIIIGIVSERLAQPDCAAGFILDGVPRTLPQAEALASLGIAIDFVIEIDVPDDEIVRRLGGRRVCSECGTPFHTEAKPPVNEGVCDVCGGSLVERTDDAPETVKNRLSVYHRMTEPLIDYYERLGKLRRIKGAGDVREITRSVLAAIEA